MKNRYALRECLKGKLFMILLEKFKSGQKIKQATGYNAFIPNKINDIWKWESSDINFLLEKANLELGELNSFADLIPNVDIYILKCI